MSFRDIVCVHSYEKRGIVLNAKINGRIHTTCKPDILAILRYYNPIIAFRRVLKCSRNRVRNGPVNNNHEKKIGIGLARYTFNRLFKPICIVRLINRHCNNRFNVLFFVFVVKDRELIYQEIYQQIK